MEGKSFTDADFPEMGWHDVQVYAIGFSPDDYELLLDIDYILQWQHPAEGEEYLRFLVAPATLAFENVTDVHIELESQNGMFSIDGLTRSDERQTPTGMKQHRWSINAHEGSLRFRATGFRQHLRQAPTWVEGQSLPIAARGGISLAEPSG